MGAILTLRDIRHRRGTREVLTIDELDLQPGERLAVLGPNGAGKTTLLRLLAGLDAPTTGTIEIDGVNLANADTSLRRRIGYATQRPGLLSTTVRRNVELPLRWRGMPRTARQATALAALERLGAGHLADRRALTLSGGEAQRVSLARALAPDPTLLLLDEPAAGLDAHVRQAFLDDLQTALADRATTLVHVSHRADEALVLADRVAILSDGTVRQLGTPPSVVQQPADATVAKLVGYDNVITVQTDRTGHVLIGGIPSPLSTDHRPGARTLAAWASAIKITLPGHGLLDATVERVSPGPGRWEMILSTSETLRAHLPLDRIPPRPGERVGIQIDPAGARIIAQSTPR